jgi:heme exporter protein A
MRPVSQSALTPASGRVKSRAMTLPDFSPTCLNVTDLSLERGDIPLISGLNLTVNPGEAVVLLGRNGVGKTTLLRALAGVLRARAGQISYSGVPTEAAASKCCVFLGHDDALKPDETPRQSLAFWAQLSQSPLPVAQAMDEMGLRALADRPSRRLSQGQKRRTALARIAVQHRPVWLLDEPAAPLDADGRARLAKIVSSHLKRGGLVVAATHQALDWPNARTQELARCAR